MVSIKPTKPPRLRRKLKEPCEIGWCELVSLPELGIKDIHAKIDSGAATSSLHAVRIKPFERDDEQWVAFTIPKSPEFSAIDCEAKLVEKRAIKSSNGRTQQRYVIETIMQLGPLTWVGHMTLANRQSMAFPVLVGRRALKRGFLVNSAKRWLLGRPVPKTTTKEI
ncbi:ATP-dependent zinc protease family protein [Parasphingorhabdus cellanae]|uniref:ATP-dependent zinc protease n=1 Tax=Parasphingorhabdus cellanae TaxID=2806553 RepID=A0ABX7T561_9SPHN|nr:RimK/LysX family protein [Parasphingorhabdus cellanae]QTD55667.1 ATP-dependent zinc protease [Parasphingorhabdus cellanae]